MSDLAPDAALTRRLDAICRRWKRSSAGARSASFWRRGVSENLGAMGLLIAVASFLVLAYLDAALWALWRGDPVSSPPEGGEIAVGGFLLVSGVGAVNLEAWLAGSTSAERSLRTWARWSRRLFAAVPLLRLYLLPAWQRLAATRPARLFRDPRDPLLDLAFPSGSGLREPRAQQWCHRPLSRPAGFAALFLADFLAWIFLLLYAGTPSTRPGLIAAAVIAHTSAAAGVALHLRFLGEGRSLPPPWGPLRWLLVLFWLLPVPMLPLLGILVYLAITVVAGTAPLGTAAWGGGLAGSDRWRRLEQRLRGRLAELAFPRRVRFEDPEREIEASRHDESISRFERIKMAWLFLEAGALGSGLARSPAPYVVQALSLVASVVAAVAVSVWLLRWLRAALRLSPATAGAETASRRGWWLLAWTQSLFALGLSFGEGVATADLHSIAGPLVLIGIAGACGEVLRLLVSMLLPAAGGRFHVWRTLAFLLVAMIGDALIEGPGSAAGGPDGPIQGDLMLFHLILLLAPLASVFAGAGHVGWLVRPYLPSDLRNDSYPRSVRRRLALLVVTAVGPFGGLAVPFWGRWRRRL